MKLSIIIVNYNVKHFLEQCLRSINKASKNLDIEIFVVDNNSVDNSIEMVKAKFPNVNTIINKKNLGFSKANNQAIRKAKGEYVLLLNPDTVIQENTLSITIDFLEKNTRAGGLGVKMIDGSGNFLPESKRSLPTPSIAFYKIFGLSYLFPKSRKFGKYHLKYLDQNKIHEIDIISGAFLMTRKKIIDKIGLLDERFFMYGEDIDLSYRIQQAGYQNFYLPTTSIIHYKGESTKKTSVNYIITFYNAMIIFSQKHYPTNTLMYLIKLAVLIRATGSIIKRIIVKITNPIIDIIVMFGVMYFLKNIWAINYFLNKNYYDDRLLKIGIPIYILFWTIGIYLKSGYHRHVNYLNIIQGFLVGTIGLLIIYGLLPETLRFSRALIILGAICSTLSVLVIRKLLNIITTKPEKKNKKIGIISDIIEYHRITEILKKSNINIEFIGQINIGKQNTRQLGHITQLKEIITIHKLNEIVFSAKDINANQIMEHMREIDKNVSIKIAPNESTFIIGSNSIQSKEKLYSLENRKHTNNSIKTFFKKYIDFFN